MTSSQSPLSISTNTPPCPPSRPPVATNPANVEEEEAAHNAAITQRIKDKIVGVAATRSTAKKR